MEPDFGGAMYNKMHGIYSEDARLTLKKNNIESKSKNKNTEKKATTTTTAITTYPSVMQGDTAVERCLTSHGYHHPIGPLLDDNALHNLPGMRVGEDTHLLLAVVL